MARGGHAGGFLHVLHLQLLVVDPEVGRPQVLLAAFSFAGAVARPLPAPKDSKKSKDCVTGRAQICPCRLLLPLLGGGTLRADQGHHHRHHHHGDGSHRDHDDDQEVAVLLRRGAAVRRPHLPDGGLWKGHREGR